MRKFVWLIFFLSTLWTQFARAAEGNILAVISHPELKIDNLAFSEVRKIFLGDRQFWSEDLLITILVPAPRSMEREILLKRIYQKTEAQYRHYWIAKVFRTEATSAPRAVSSSQMAGELLSTIPGSISVVDSLQIPQGVKVLKIDGKLPNQPGYPLR